MKFIETESDLEELLTRPRPELISFIRSVSSPLLLLGAGGKMGPTLAILARRAADAANHPLDVIAVSRFSDPRARQGLEQNGVKTISADLLERNDMQKLPDAENVIHLAGFKFGTAQNPSMTWAVNTVIPAYVAERYATSRMVALSTGNVYPMSKFSSGGVTENHALTPKGEYPNAAVARERIFEYFSRKNGTRLALLRLSYAFELRYGVVVDIARKVWARESISLSNGYFNCIWQGDANEMILRSLALASSPCQAWNLNLPKIFKVRDVAEQFAQLLGKPAHFTNTETETALLANASRLCAELGEPATSPESVLPLIAHWITTDGRSLNRPTHFEVRDGVY
jgi:hypothetical protein